MPERESPASSMVRLSIQPSPLSSTGIFSIKFVALELPDPATNIQVAYTKAVSKLAVDNGAGVLTGDVGAGPNTVSYTLGTVALTTLASQRAKRTT